MVSPCPSQPPPPPRPAPHLCGSHKQIPLNHLLPGSCCRILSGLPGRAAGLSSGKAGPSGPAAAGPESHLSNTRSPRPFDSDSVSTANTAPPAHTRTSATLTPHPGEKPMQLTMLASPAPQHHLPIRAKTGRRRGASRGREPCPPATPHGAWEPSKATHVCWRRCSQGPLPLPDSLPPPGRQCPPHPCCAVLCCAGAGITVRAFFIVPV